MRKKRKSYKFTEKKHSKRGVISFLMASLILAIYSGFIYQSYKGGGNVSAYYGGFGVMTMCVSFVTLVISATSLKEEDSFQLFPRLSLGVSILSVICWTGTYIMGFIM